MAVDPRLYPYELEHHTATVHQSMQLNQQFVGMLLQTMIQKACDQIILGQVTILCMIELGGRGVV